MNRHTVTVGLLLLFVFPLSAQEVRVAGLEFKGNRHVSSGKLKQVMQTKSRPWHQKAFFWQKAPVFDQETLIQDLLRLERFYQQEGYLEARVEDYELVYNDKRDRVKIVIKLYEGEPTVVERVDFFSVTDQRLPIALKELHRILKLRPGRRYREEDLRHDYDRIVGKFSDNGYPYVIARVKPVVDRARHRVELEWRLDAGPHCRFGAITILGNQSVSKSVILRGLGFRPGERFVQRELVDAQSQVYRLELFQFVSLRALDLDRKTDTIPIEVRVRETKLRTLKFGLGWGSEESFRGFVRWRHRNFLGGGRILALEARHSQELLPLKLELELSQPYFLGNRNDLNVKPFFIWQDEPGFEAKRLGLQTTFSRRLTRRTNMFLTGQVERDTVDVKAQMGPQQKPPEEGEFFKSILRFGLRRESINELFSPTRGSVARVVAEHAGPLFDAKFRYLKFTFEYKKFKEVKPGNVLAWRILIGTMGPVRGSAETPVEERFFSGGSFSVRGWPRSFLGPLEERTEVDTTTGKTRTTVVPRGGNSLLEGSLELRFPVFKKIKAAVFLDFGNVWAKPDGFSLGDLHYAVGGGLRYETVVGPIRFDWAYKINRQPLDASDYQVHVSLGQAF